MIFNTAVLKKMMKTAYKGNGLLVAKNYGRIILGGSYWRLQIYEDYFPNKAKASLVELIGTLPLNGETFRCTSDGNQHELPKDDLEKLIEDMTWNEPYVKSKLIIETINGDIRPYQNKKGDTIFLNEVFASLVDGKEAEDNEDPYINGPCKHNVEDSRVFFMSDTCILEAWECRPNVDDKKDPIATKLSKTMLELADMDLPC